MSGKLKSPTSTSFSLKCSSAILVISSIRLSFSLSYDNVVRVTATVYHLPSLRDHWHTATDELFAPPVVASQEARMNLIGQLSQLEIMLPQMPPKNVTMFRFHFY